jgi:uncharacterized protein YndB with AHSA1/START domain
MPTVERSLTVSTPQDVVWSYLSDFTRTEDWDPPTVSTTRVRGTGDVGTVYRNLTRFWGREVRTDYTVVRHEPVHLLQLEGCASSMRTLDTMTLTAEPDGSTTVTYRAEFRPQGAAGLLSPLLALGLKKLGDDTARTMRRCLEQLRADVGTEVPGEREG